MSLKFEKRYPKRFELQDGSIVTVRPMSRADESGLVELFRGLPPEERYFLKDDVTSPLVIREWIDSLDYEKVLPLLALDEREIVADAALLRHRAAAFGHAAEIRVVVAPEYRKRGLAVALIEELTKVARDSDLEEVVFEFVADVQAGAVEAAEFVGAATEAVLKDWVRDADGKRHDVLFMRLTL